MNSTQNEICRLCGQETIPFSANEFFLCHNCNGISRKLNSLPEINEEKKRYDLHQNSPGDGYENFIAPLFNYVLKNISLNKNGLDFGCGPDSVISKMLSEKKYIIKKYDPFYENSIYLSQKLKRMLLVH